jgi:hypothetical protein
MIVALVHAADVPLNFARLDLLDGRKLKNVVVKSYDLKSERLLVIADGKAMMIPIASVPPPFNQQLKSAPASGASVSTISPAPRPIISAADQYHMEVTARVPQQAPVRVAPPRRAERPRSGDPMLADATLAQHQAAAHGRAQRYFRYEFQIGSNSISVTSLDFEVGVPAAVPGWTGRYCTNGKAFIEYFDSKGRSYQRTTSTFEITTEQKPGEALTVIDFSRKS